MYVVQVGQLIRLLYRDAGMSVYISVFERVGVYVCWYLHVDVCMCMYACGCVHVYVCMWMCTCVCVCRYVYLLIHLSLL